MGILSSRNGLKVSGRDSSMSACGSKIQLRRRLLGGLLALLAGASSAAAEVLVPFTPGNLLVPIVDATVTESNGIYTYAYRITLDGSDPAKQQKAWRFLLKLHGDVSNIESPRGWVFQQFRREPLYDWACVESVPLEATELDDGNLPPCQHSIAPGSMLDGFSFKSIHPPGSVQYRIQGEKKWPVATDEDDDLGSAGNSDIFADSAPGETIGPVPVQTCVGAPNGADCDDGYFCNGDDSCLDQTCSEHAGSPCPGAENGDSNCMESCDEDKNSCTRNDYSGTPCADDGNPCTSDKCIRGVCVHRPGNSGAVCLEQTGCQSESTCTGASIVCPAPSSLPSGTACTGDR